MMALDSWYNQIWRNIFSSLSRNPSVLQIYQKKALNAYAKGVKVSGIPLEKLTFKLWSNQ